MLFALGLLAGASTAHAADMPLKAPALKSVYDWTGFYVGGHFGYGGGSLGPGTNPLPEQGVLFPTSVTGVIGGYQIGYNRELANRIVLGVEADSTFTAPLDHVRPRADAADRLQQHHRLCRHRARPHRLCLRSRHALRHRRLRLGTHQRRHQ